MLREGYSVNLDEEGHRFLRELDRNTLRMHTLIDDLLTFSKLGRKDIKKLPVDMHELIQSVVSELPPSKISIVTDEILPALADPSLIRHVIVNIISNAVKYSSKVPLPSLRISSRKVDAMIEYSFADNGVGFDMRYADKLFGVFQRLHSSEDFEGTGVGLATAQRIVHKHGGKIWAEGKVNEGATFSFTLPDAAPKL
jgi:light-regulated signal transduction histidine kinase (bacteriophytochrome)